MKKKKTKQNKKKQYKNRFRDKGEKNKKTIAITWEVEIIQLILTFHVIAIDKIKDKNINKTWYDNVYNKNTKNTSEM